MAGRAGGRGAGGAHARTAACVSARATVTNRPAPASTSGPAAAAPSGAPAASPRARPAHHPSVEGRASRPLLPATSASINSLHGSHTGAAPPKVYGAIHAQGGAKGEAADPKHQFYGGLPMKAGSGADSGAPQSHPLKAGGGAGVGRGSRRPSIEVAPSVHMSDFFTAVAPLRTH